MTWITIAIIGYLFAAAANILDKYILSAKIQQPSTYAFFVAVFSLFALVAIPFGARILPFDILVLALISGALSVYGFLFFYRAVRESDISRVAPILGVFMALLVLMYAFSMQFITGDILNRSLHGYASNITAFWLLLIGGFLMAFDLPLRKTDAFPKIHNVALSSILLVSSLVILKHVYHTSGFVSGFVWSRIGLFLGGLSLFIIPVFRREILTSLNGMSESRSEQASVGIWFVTNKVLGALGNVFVQYAIFLGSLVVVEALAGLQYAFVFLMAAALSTRFPNLYQEKLYCPDWLHCSDWVQKIIALILIGLGLYFSSVGGSATFLAFAGLY